MRNAEDKQRELDAGLMPRQEERNHWEADFKRLQRENDRLRNLLLRLDGHEWPIPSESQLFLDIKEALAADREPFNPTAMAAEVFKDARPSTKEESKAFKRAVRKDREPQKWCSKYGGLYDAERGCSMCEPGEGCYAEREPDAEGDK
jgi:hypothetical protein